MPGEEETRDEGDGGTGKGNKQIERGQSWWDVGGVAVNPLPAERRAARSRQPALRLAPLALASPSVALRPLRRGQVKVTERRRRTVRPRHNLTDA